MTSKSILSFDLRKVATGEEREKLSDFDRTTRELGLNARRTAEMLFASSLKLAFVNFATSGSFVVKCARQMLRCGAFFLGHNHPRLRS
jgi:hypothetical protein